MNYQSPVQNPFDDDYLWFKCNKQNATLSEKVKFRNDAIIFLANHRFDKLQIGKLIGLSENMVWRIAKELDLKLLTKSYVKLSQEVADQLYHDYTSSRTTCGKLALKYNLSYSTVSYAIRKKKSKQ